MVGSLRTLVENTTTVTTLVKTLPRLLPQPHMLRLIQHIVLDATEIFTTTLACLKNTR